jgi:hemerythrin
MSLLYWTPPLLIQIDELDNQHRKIFELANIFYNNIYQNTSEKEQIESLIELTSYAAFHFGEEERIMELTKDPNRDRHKKEHNEFINDLTKIKNSLSNGNLTLSVSLIEFLRNSIINHIFVTDREMAGHIIKSGFEYNP